MPLGLWEVHFVKKEAQVNNLEEILYNIDTYLWL